MRVNRDIASLLVLLLVFVVGGFLLAGRGGGSTRRSAREDVPNPSVFNDRASGTKACFAWTNALGYRAQAWRENWNRLPSSGASVLLVLDPRAQPPAAPLTEDDSSDDDGDGTGKPRDPTILQPADADVLLAWVRAGHTAIVCKSRLPGGPGTFGERLDLVSETAARSQRVEFSPLQPTPETAGILSLHSRAQSRLRRVAPDGVALFGDSDGPLVLDIAVGKGRLVAIADSYFASNRSLPHAENALFLARLLARAAPPGSTVLFDEYHHGDAALSGAGGMWDALGRPLQLTLTQLMLALAVLVGVLAVRFGAPVPLVRPAGRVSSEYVASLAGLYRRAGASAPALETVYRQFLRDVTGRLALAPDVSLEGLAMVAARRGGVDGDRLRTLLADCEERLDKKNVSDADLLELTRRMEQMRKDMGIG